MKEITAKINKSKSWLFEQIKLINHQLDSSRKKGEKTQINGIRNEKGEETTNTAEIERIIRDYCKQLYVNKMDKLEKMGKFLEKYNLPRLNH